MFHRLTLVVSCAALVSVSAGQAQSNASDLAQEVTELETRVLGTSPQSETVSQRMDAVEIGLFGHSQSGGLLSRLSRARMAVGQTGEAAGPAKSLASITSPRAPAGNLIKATIQRTESVALPLLQREQANTVAMPQTLLSEVNPLYTKGYAAYKAGKLSAAKQLFDKQANLAPTAAPPYYAMGLIAEQEKDDSSALANFALAWYLQPNNEQYLSAYNASKLRMRTVADPLFASADYEAGDGKALLNLGVRLWKLGYTPAAARLFAWTARNVPKQSDVADYDLGAVAENQHDLQLALQYYQAAANEFKLQGHDALYKLYTAGLPANAPFPFAAVAVSEKQLNGTINSVRFKLKAADKSWKGWTQLRASGASRICPCCIIDRGESY